MLKNFELIKKQLVELSQAVNSFKSEAVQLRIVELIFGAASEDPDVSEDQEGTHSAIDRKNRKGRKKRMSAKARTPAKSDGAKPSKQRSAGGATDVLRQLADEGFFKTPKLIGEIVEHCNVKLAKKFKANELSPGLLKLVREKVLDRDKDKETNQYKYRKK